jgi:type III secretory pathway lipoprotein EscJ
MRAAVLLQRRARSAPLDDGPVRKLVAAAVQGLQPDAVSVVQVESEPAEPSSGGWVAVGPFSTTRASAKGLRVTLGAALALHLILALVVVVLTRRRHNLPAA